jgi:hypothetical protein
VVFTVQHYPKFSAIHPYFELTLIKDHLWVEWSVIFWRIFTVCNYFFIIENDIHGSWWGLQLEAAHNREWGCLRGLEILQARSVVYGEVYVPRIWGRG